MKKHIFNKSLAFLLSTTVFFTGCEKEETADISTVTTYADITLTGGNIYTIELGSAASFTDPGFTAKDAEDDPVEVKTTRNTVNVNKLGSYVVEYEAVNADGFVSTNRRVVNVIQKPIHASIAGEYVRESNNRPATVNQLGDGYYLISDVWGTASFTTGAPSPQPAYLLNFKGDSLMIVPSPTTFGTGVIAGRGIIMPNGDLSIETDLGGVAKRVNPWKKK